MTEQKTVTPAEVFPVAAILIEEVQARGIDFDLLAMGMCKHTEDYGVIRMALDFTLAITHDPHLHLGADLAAGLERALGISADIWLATDAAYRRWLLAGGKPWVYDGDIDQFLSDIGDCPDTDLNTGEAREGE